MSDEPTEEETPVEETPVEETPAEETPVEETPAPEAPAEEAPAAEAPSAPAAEEEDGEPAEVPTSKQLRKKARGAHKGVVKTSRSNEERSKERAEVRATKAASRRRWRARQKTKRNELRGPDVPAKTAPAPREPGNPTIRQGLVVSDKGEKTITVRIDTARRHPKYHKIVRSSTTLRVHDESNDANEGDTVRVIECRPMSRTKRWRLDEVMERAK
ncbi:unannotated protein [freshwater metagenome]|uniref:Unannotated protein n=1 Tax=freshwater metagenome TaxID=449393 RepID=A0A6J7DTL4_9ZZZZ